MQVINWKIPSHFMNWVTVFLMVFIFMFAVRMLIGESASKVPGPKLAA